MRTRITRPNPRRRALFALLCAVLLVLAGCSTTVTGSAVRDPSFTTGDPLPALMNAGNYPTKPLPPLGPAGDKGKIIESHRMGDALVGPWEVDPLLIEGSSIQIPTFSTAASLNNLLLAPGSEIAARNSYLTGFVVARSSKEPPGQLKSLATGLLRFAAPENATAAAGQFASEFLLPRDDLPASRPFGIPGHPEALTRTYSETDNTAVVESYTPRGPFVIYSYSRVQEGNPDVGAQLIAKSLDMQYPRLDEFQPTAPDKLADLPLDPTGVFAKTLPGPDGAGTVMDGTYPPRAALFIQIDPFLSKKLFDEAGLTVLSLGPISTVYETRDAAGAKTLYDGFKAGDPSPDQKPAPGVPGFPAAKCFEGENMFGKATFSCAYTADRYLVLVNSNRDGDLQQRAASQYLMLTAK